MAVRSSGLVRQDGGERVVMVLRLSVHWNVVLLLVLRLPREVIECLDLRLVKLRIHDYGTEWAVYDLLLAIRVIWVIVRINLGTIGLLLLLSLLLLRVQMLMNRLQRINLLPIRWGTTMIPKGTRIIVIIVIICIHIRRLRTRVVGL